MVEKGPSFRPLLIIGATSLFLFFSYSCEKPEERLLGKDALADEDRLSTGITDTLRVESRTVSMPEVPAVNSTPGMIGKLRDPRTGLTRTAFFSQLLLPSNNLDLGDPNDLELDSAVLSLRYGGYYGDTSTSQEFRVHQVLESMDGIDPDHNDSLPYSVTPIGDKNSIPHVNKQVQLDNGETLPPQLRIRLKDSFGKNILDRSGEEELSNDDAFTSFMNGVMVTSRNSVNDDEGATLFMVVPHEHSKVTLFYRNTAQNDTHTLDLSFDGTHFNQVDHDPSGSEMEARIDGSFSKDQEKSYVLGPGAYATEIRFPSLKEFDAETPIAINRAELKLPVETSNSSSIFPPSVSLHALYEDESGDIQITTDRLEEGAEFFGGAYDKKNHRYTLRISRHIQEVLNGAVESTSLFITTSIPILEEGAANTVSRSVLKGPGAGKEGPILELTYTEHEDPS